MTSVVFHKKGSNLKTQLVLCPMTCMAIRKHFKVEVDLQTEARRFRLSDKKWASFMFLLCDVHLHSMKYISSQYKSNEYTIRDLLTFPTMSRQINRCLAPHRVHLITSLMDPVWLGISILYITIEICSFETFTFPLSQWNVHWVWFQW